MNQNNHAHHEDIEENFDVKDVVNVEDVGQEGEVHAETTDVATIDPVLAPHIMSFLKGLVGPGVIPSVQETQDPGNPPISSIALKLSGMRSNDAFFRPLLGFVVSGNEHEIMT